MPTTRQLRSDSENWAARVEQFVSTLTHRHSEEIDQRISAILADDRQWRLVNRLSAFDRAHVLRVHDRLLSQGAADPDLLRAALLHDVGKSNGRHQARIWDRTARVLGRQLTPTLWRRLAGRRTRFFEGFYLAEHHARLGAAAAADAGASPRCCELILRHEETFPTGDHLLDALITADEAV